MQNAECRIEKTTGRRRLSRFSFLHSAFCILHFRVPAAALLVLTLFGATVSAQPAAARADRWESALDDADATGKLSLITDLDSEIAAAAKELKKQPARDAIRLAGSMLRYLARATELHAPIAPKSRDAVRAGARALDRREAPPAGDDPARWIPFANPTAADQALYARYYYWLHRTSGEIEPLRRAFVLTRLMKDRGWKNVPATDPIVQRWAAEAYREAVVLEKADLQALGLAPKGLGYDFSVSRLPVPEYAFTPRAPAPEFAHSGKYDLDDKGILVVEYGNSRQYGDIGRQYNSTFIAHYVMALHRDYLLHGGPDIRENLFRNVDWLIEHHDAKSWNGLEYWIWSFDFDNDHFAAKAPWFSGLAQGRILVALAQAYELSGNIEYYRAAERTLRSFYVPADVEGITTWGADHAWFEEVAAVGTGSSKILNGHISAIAGLWSYMEWLGRSDVRRLYDLGVNAVLRDLPHYDAGFLSYYSDEQHKHRTFAPVRNYNSLHVHQLLWLYAVCEHPRFLDYAMRFARYDDPGQVITVAGSTNEKTNGPDKLNMTMGRNFWSHSKFPTWVQVDLGSQQEVDGVTLLGYIQRAAPRDFDVLISSDAKEWTTVVERKGSAAQYATERFPKQLARYVKVVVHRDNGNKNVALTGVGIHRGNGGNRTAVSDWNSYGTRNRPAYGFARDDRGWSLNDPSTLYLDLVKPVPMSILFDGRGANEMFVYGSNDLQKWERVNVTRTGVPTQYRYEIASSRHRYLKLDVPKLLTTGAFRFEPQPAAAK